MREGRPAPRRPSARGLTLGRLALRSLARYRGPHLAAAAAAAVATAVIAGSLVVRDSMRTSLETLAAERLGRARYALAGGNWFPEDLASRVERRLGPGGAAVAPAVIAAGAARHPETGAVASGVAVVGVSARFSDVVPGLPAGLPSGRSAVVNRALADDLGLRPGDAVLLAFDRGGVPALGTAFGRGGVGDTSGALRAEVAAVAPMAGPGLFTLRADRPRPRTVYVALERLQAALGREGAVNVLLSTAAVAPAAMNAALESAATPGDIGIRPTLRPDRLDLSYDLLVFPEPLAAAIERAAAAAGCTARRVSFNLAVGMRLERPVAGARPSVPYSTIAGFSHDPASPVRLRMRDGSPGSPGPGGIVLGAWAADDLRARPGDRLVVTYYAAEPDGTLASREETFTVSGVAAMEGAAADRGLVPEIERVTDAASIGAWDPPFPVDLGLVSGRDEEFWDRYGPAPKAFLSLETAIRLWGRSGGVTGLFVTAPDGRGGERAPREDWMAPAMPGIARASGRLSFAPVRQEAMRAAGGTTDFAALFLALGSFLIGAALLLTALLTLLGVERRAAQFGTLLAVGFSPRQVAGLAMLEGFAVCAAGAAAGCGLGVGYAGLILRGLATAWSGAVGPWPLSLHARPASLAAGFLAGLPAAMAGVAWAAGRLRRLPAARLLAGGGFARTAGPRGESAGAAAAAVCAAGAAVSLLRAGAAPAAGFFAAGGFSLVGALFLLRTALGGPGGRRRARRPSVPMLAWRGACRNRTRSLLTAGLIACAVFVVATVAANRRDPGRSDVRDRRSGAGGFNLLGWCDVPLHHDPGTAAGRRALGFTDEESRLLGRAAVYSFLANDGEDVSCLNLQKVSVPLVLGVPDAFIGERKGFSFVRTAGSAGDPWGLLREDGRVFLDAATAEWNLRVRLGGALSLNGRRAVVTGLLRDSVFAGAVLTGEESFRRAFGPAAGRRFFLIETTAADEKPVADLLRERFGGLGFRVTPTREALAAYGAVANAYMAAFETLGGLGLLLGTIGLLAVVLRGVLERRGETAMLLALGLRRRQAAGIIAVETGLLVIGGMAIGAAAALLASAPALASAERDVDWARLAAVLLACAAAGVAPCAAAAPALANRATARDLRSE